MVMLGNLLLLKHMSVYLFQWLSRQFTLNLSHNKCIPSLLQKVYALKGQTILVTMEEYSKKSTSSYSNRKIKKIILKFCSSLGITWKFIPEHAPHFGGLWESAVKGMKHHGRDKVHINFEELSTKIEACMNSRPLTPISSTEDAIEVLTPGHFLIGQPIEAIPTLLSPINVIETLAFGTILASW